MFCERGRAAEMGGQVVLVCVCGLMLSEVGEEATRMRRMTRARLDGATIWRRCSSWVLARLAEGRGRSKEQSKFQSLATMLLRSQHRPDSDSMDL